jgi:hypothetical protein
MKHKATVIAAASLLSFFISMEMGNENFPKQKNRPE